MIDKLLKIREDFRYAISLEDRTLLGFALNDLDTFLHKNKQALNIDSVVLPTEKEGTLCEHAYGEKGCRMRDMDLNCAPYPTDSKC